ncbi:MULTISPECIES: glycerol-3-phosphate 1-O-acyltransferase PlsY [Pseudovibrio]|uniref:glycerol-3-phosphate 1-O-acyltransferase PlsY n=1 Tax=Stappiaceae TaxID=2821832 RepID=UPI0023655484|nr:MULTISPECIES: glycerol-3-phosphate 1-O-acyltransferase PlsY [Pseudovibrio]MDD7910700.1 glycerol-3-phosphate 1-O-acyltransferase PlsY [Pseudovibrio exalbescens]MDX5594461.1 glycerol-3-phosphate 1-O-acyltransferase PlsY [Pseudovibrio sp. SPO723]
MPDPISWSYSLPYYMIALAIGYILGSIPFGLLITKAAGLGDIRQIGSGNIGTTNVLRTGKKSLAALTLLCDALKGTLAVVIAYIWLGNDAAMIAGLGAFLGHLFPVWLKFKGGKGVATYIGILLGLNWPFALVFMVIWLLVAFITKYSSLSALVSSLLIPFVLVVFDQWQLAEITGLLGVMLWLKHHENISRLLKGTEGKIGSKG